MAPLSIGQRIYLGAVAALALWVGFWCYFIPARSAIAIPWQLPTLCATFLGSMYLSGATFTCTCMCARRWVDVRVVMPVIAMWTGGLTLISLFYLPLFDFNRHQVWIWFGAYILYPLIALGFMWTHRRQSGSYPVDEPALPEWARRYLRVQGGLMVILGTGLLFATKAMGLIWPWHTGRLMLQLYSAPLLAYGIGSFNFARQHTRSEIRLGLVAIGVFTGAELAATVFRVTSLDGPPLSIAIWFAWLAVTTGMLASLVWTAFRRTAHSTIPDLATDPEMKMMRIP